MFNRIIFYNLFAFVNMILICATDVQDLKKIIIMLFRQPFFFIVVA